MTPYLWILVLASLAGTRAQDLDLSDFFDADPTPAAKPGAAPTPAKPDKAPPKTADDGFDLSDALGPDPTKAPKKPAGDPSKTGGTGDFNILDALDNDPEKPGGDPKKPVPPKHGGGGGGFSDSDLSDVAGSDDYKPDPGRGGKGRAVDPSHDTDGQSGDSQDLNQQWLKLLKLLGDKIPEGLHAWIANSRQVIMSLLERVMELIEQGEGEKQS